MIIKELKINNFGIFSGDNSFQFNPAVVSEKNITLIGGKNGCGKTTILDAVLLALYGKRSLTVKESGMPYSAYLKKCIHKETESATVELSFTIPSKGDFIDFRIKRSWLNQPRPNDRLEIWQNNNYDEHLAENWDTFVEEIVPSGIAGLFFFDGEKISRLAEEEETSETTQQSIKAMLGIDIIDNLVNDMKKIIKRNEVKITGLQNRDTIKNLEDEWNSLDLQVQHNKQILSNLNLQKDRTEQKLKEKEKGFLKEGGTLGINRSKITETKANIKASLAVKKIELINLAAGSLPLLLVAQYLEEIKVTVDKEDKIKAAKYIYSFFEDFNKEFSDMLETFEGLSETKKGQINKFLTEKTDQIYELKSEKQKFELSPGSIQNIEKLLANKKEMLEDLSKNLDAFAKMEINLEQAERYLLADVDEGNTNKLLTEIKDLTLKTNKIDHDREEINKEISRWEGFKTDLEFKIVKAKQQEFDQLNIRNESTRIIKYAAKTQEIMGEFKRSVLENKVEKLAFKITECFNYITYKESLVSKIEIEPETLRLTLFNSKHIPILKSELSAGERQMLAISILWGLASCSNHSLPVIIDTPLGRLDSSHRTYFVSKYLPNASHQVIVLSTDEEIKSPYLEMIEKHIAGKYLLKYDNEKHSTTIQEGYFEGKVS